MTCSTFQVKPINDIAEESEKSFIESPVEFDVILEEEEENKMNTSEKSPMKSSAKPPATKRTAKSDIGKNKDRSSPKKAKSTLKKEKKTGETTAVLGRKKLEKVKKRETSKASLSKRSSKKPIISKTIAGKKDKMCYFDNDSLPLGWKKQLVTRKSGASAGKVDMYIYSPDGTKFRSKVELAAYLLKKKSMLKVEQFGFGKKPGHTVLKGTGSSSKSPAVKVTKSTPSSPTKKSEESAIKSEESPKKSEESPKKSEASRKKSEASPKKSEESPKKFSEKSPEKEVIRFRVDMTPSEFEKKRVVPKAVWLENCRKLEMVASKSSTATHVDGGGTKRAGEGKRSSYSD